MNRDDIFEEQEQLESLAWDFHKDECQAFARLRKATPGTPIHAVAQMQVVKLRARQADIFDRLAELEGEQLFIEAVERDDDDDEFEVAF
jgi:hypothetical protein